MIKPPYTKWINDIKTKLGFNRTMTASGADVVDAVNKQSQQIDDLQKQAGDTQLPTTAQTLTGAIAENSNNISDLVDFNAVENKNITFTGGVSLVRGALTKTGHVVVLNAIIRTSTVLTSNSRVFTVPNDCKPVANLDTIITQDHSDLAKPQYYLQANINGEFFVTGANVPAPFYYRVSISWITNN